jgi:hypothetical protein
MKLARSPESRPIIADWHKSRQAARERAYSGDLEAQFSNTEIIKYDLETAQITGEDNPRLFIFNRAIDVFGVNGTDVRNLRDR